jgi:hypothetical protein
MNVFYGNQNGIGKRSRDFSIKLDYKRSGEQNLSVILSCGEAVHFVKWGMADE